jgi:outer membrane protein, multidrug efflux system
MRRWLLVCAAIALSACESLPWQRPSILLPLQWQGSSPTGTASLTDSQWSEVLPVPELSTLIDEALANNSDLLIAVERIELARVQYGIDRAGMYPTIRLDAAATRQRTPGIDPTENQVNESATAGLSIPSWEIDLWGKLRDRAEVARRELLAQEALAQGVRISLVAQVASLYLELIDLDNQIAITERTIDSRRRALRLNQRRHDEGVSSIIDVYQAESLLATAVQTLAEQQRRRALSENGLSVLIGRMPGQIPRRQNLVDLPPPAELLAGLPSDLLLRRPDIIAAEESLRGADANINAARKAYLPSITVTTLLGFASPVLSQLFDSGRYAWSVQPAVGMNLFDAGRTRFGVERAESQRRILLEQYKLTIRQAFREVNDQLIAFEKFESQRVAAGQVVAANRSRLRVANSRYLNGVSSYFEVLDAERQLLDAEIGLSQSSRAIHQSVVQLYRALGGGWQRKVTEHSPDPRHGEKVN